MHGADVARPVRPLDAAERRVLGTLIEKGKTTPDQYPLSLNALVTGCNQKSNRDPVLELEAGEVGHALRDLEGRGLVRSVHGSRAQRYEHRFAQAWSVWSHQDNDGYTPELPTSDF